LERFEKPKVEDRGRRRGGKGERGKILRHLFSYMLYIIILLLIYLYIKTIIHIILEDEEAEDEEAEDVEKKKEKRTWSGRIFCRIVAKGEKYS
jgi:flagellar biosynthesis/type III secretory pathway M-ring protein FliF/YscJ